MKRLLLTFSCLLISTAGQGAEPAVWQDPLTGMDFIRIPPGCMQIGTNKKTRPKVDDFWYHIGFKDSLSADEMPRHKICVSAFWLGRNEVRRQDWHAVMGGDSPSAENAAVPVGNVSWEQAQEFARKLSERSAGTARYRLPTEAEWEYACRAGSDKEEPIPYTSEMVGKAWHNTAGLRLLAPKPVGELPPNPFGLNDMLGNVWEWVEDAYSPAAYRQHAVQDPVYRGPADGKNRVIRGGGYRSEPLKTRCGARGHYAGAGSLPQIGLRLVRIEEAKQ